GRREDQPAWIFSPTIPLKHTTVVEIHPTVLLSKKFHIHLDVSDHFFNGIFVITKIITSIFFHQNRYRQSLQSLYPLKDLSFLVPLVILGILFAVRYDAKYMSYQFLQRQCIFLIDERTKDA